MKQFLIGITLLCLAISSQAAVTLTVSSDQGWGNHILSLASDGEPISGFEITVIGVVDIDAEPFPGFIVNTLYADQALALGPDINKDTHLLISQSDITVASGNETDTEILNAAVGLAIPALSLDIANVVPAIYPCDCIIKVVTGTGDNKTLYDGSKGELMLVNDSGGNLCYPPEPASLATLALAGLIVMRRK